MTPRVMPLSAATAAGCEPETRTVSQLTRQMVRMREDAWTEFHERYFSRLLGYAVTLHRGDRAAAEDSVQSGYLRAVRHIRRFDDESAFWSWLTLLVRCAAADRGRKIAARSRLHQMLAQNLESAAVAAVQKPDHTRLVFLDEALARLAPEDRRLLEEKYDHGLANAELAAARRLTEKAVECRLRRLRRKLKRSIDALARQTRP